MSVVNDRVVLNVGGKRFETTITTLRTLRATLLGRMFAPENSHLRRPDPDGSFFFDRDGDMFVHVLNVYRTNETPTFSDSDLQQRFDCEAKFWGVLNPDKSIYDAKAVRIESICDRLVKLSNRAEYNEFPGLAAPDAVPAVDFLLIGSAIGILKATLKLMEPFVSEVTFLFTQDGLCLSQFDMNTCAWLHFCVPRKFFRQFTCTANSIKFTVSLFDFATAVKNTGVIESALRWRFSAQRSVVQCFKIFNDADKPEQEEEEDRKEADREEEKEKANIFYSITIIDYLDGDRYVDCPIQKAFANTVFVNASALSNAIQKLLFGNQNLVTNTLSVSVQNDALTLKFGAANLALAATTAGNAANRFCKTMFVVLQKNIENVDSFVFSRHEKPTEASSGAEEKGETEEKEGEGKSDEMTKKVKKRKLSQNNDDDDKDDDEQDSEKEEEEGNPTIPASVSVNPTYVKNWFRSELCSSTNMAVCVQKDSPLSFISRFGVDACCRLEMSLAPMTIAPVW